MNLLKIIITLALLISSLPLFAQDNGTNAVTTPPPVAQATITNTISPFQQAVRDFQKVVNRDGVMFGGDNSETDLGYAEASKIIKMTTAMDKLPPIPEEARMHFVKGQAIFSAATSKNDFFEAGLEFWSACYYAPWWQNAWYNLSLAWNAEGSKSGSYYALVCLKLYQDFKLSDDDARTAQDMVYKIQAIRDLAAKHVADAANAQAAAQAQADADAKNNTIIKSIQGDWSDNNNLWLISISSDGGGQNVVIRGSYGGQAIPISDVGITGKTLQFTMSQPCDACAGGSYPEIFKLSMTDNGMLMGSRHAIQTFQNGTQSEQTIDVALHKR